MVAEKLRGRTLSFRIKRKNRKLEAHYLQNGILLVLKPDFKIILTIMQLKLCNSILLYACLNQRIVLTKLFDIFAFHNDNSSACSCLGTGYQNGTVMKPDF